MPFRRLLLIPALVLLVATSGCRDAKIATYRVPKETPPPAATNAPSADPHAGLGIPPVKAVSPAPAPAPASTPAPTDMASTPVPTANNGEAAGQQAELAVTAFPGDVGGNLANVNRWRQQLQLAPIDANDLNSVLTHIHVGDLHIDLAELLGPAPADEGKPRLRVLGAIVPHNGATWFFKLTGPDALVAREKNAFIAFIQSIQPAR